MGEFKLENQVIEFKALHPLARRPEIKTLGSSGADVRSVKRVDLLPGDIKLVPTGLAVAIPRGFELQLRPRSGLAFEHGITVLNAPGTIDSDYRGELKALLINHGPKTFSINAGDRIAQLIMTKVIQPQYKEVDVLDSTERGSGGYGHTGRD